MYAGHFSCQAAPENVRHQWRASAADCLHRPRHAISTRHPSRLGHLESHVYMTKWTLKPSMLPTLARRGLNPFAAPKAPAVNVPFFPYTWETNPYRCKRTWPPEFSKLSQKHQFKLERRYRRRAKLAYARPNWHKIVQLAQWGSILFVATYGILFMELTDGNTPFTGVSGLHYVSKRMRTDCR